jgi:hypothetical protein
VELDRIAAAIRPRTPWESIDLGFALARTWFLPLWLCWWLTAAPVALMALAALRHADWWLLLLWWFKPAFEALPLYWLSRAMFGERLALRDAARRLPAALPPRLWPQVLWRRFSALRAANMPVTLLEAPRGAARRARLRVLGSGAAGWLTVLCAHLEAVIWLSALLLVAFLLPRGVPLPELLSTQPDTAAVAHWLGALLAVLAISVMAPFYVAAGFGLYLGRRTELEAWDLELAFRRAATGTRAARRTVPLLVLGAALALLPLLPDSAQAEVPGREQARALIDAVLADPEFGSTRESRVWVYVGEADESTAPAAEDRPWLPIGLIQVIAEIIKWALLVAAMVLLALLVHRVVRELDLGRRRGRAAANTTSAATLPGEAGAPLPADIPAAVHRLIAAGDTRGALALLYQAQIAQLAGAGLDLPASATEGECLSMAARTAPVEQVRWLRRLLALWQAVAYGRRDADAAAVAALLAAYPTPDAPASSHG